MSEFLNILRNISPILVCLLVCCAKIVEITIQSLKTCMMVKGQRLKAAGLGLLECTIWGLVISTIIGTLGDNIFLLLFYCVGYATGLFLGSTIESFWRYDYNYRSSVASVIHSKMKKECNIPGSTKSISERTDAEKRFFRELEHKRWNAYVRSDGFVYAPIRDKLAKTHNLLVPFDKLTYEEQIKDDN